MNLCDRVYAMLLANSVAGADEMYSSHKFHLGDDFTAVLRKICTTAEDIDSLKHLMKLPYPITWIEDKAYGALMHNIPDDKKEYLESLTRKANADSIKYDPDKAILINLFYHDKTMIPGVIAFPESLYTSEKGNIRLPLMILDRDYISDYDKTLLTTDLLEIFLRISIINSPSLIESESVYREKLNRKRAKNNKLPLFDYKILRIKKNIRNAMSSSSSSDGDVRQHWRRGHFKARKTGLFWWSPHLAGRKENGVIIKDYVA